jgi:hypothetical protein
MTLPASHGKESASYIIGLEVSLLIVQGESRGVIVSCMVDRPSSIEEKLSYAW